jgi:Glycosyltransferase family 9 (heptosyltransferase)
MPAPPLQPIVIWFGRVGDMILLSALLEILHGRYRGGCHVIGAGAFPAQIYAAHRDVARVTTLHRYTVFLFDPAWWRALRALHRSRDDPVYVCEYDPRKLARIRRLLKLSGIDAARCVFITRTACLKEASAEPSHRGDAPAHGEAAPPHSPSSAPSHRGDAPAHGEAAPPQASISSPSHWVDRLVCFGRLTPRAFNAADYPWPSPPPRSAPRLEVSEAARAECEHWIEAQGWSARPLVLIQPGNRRTMRGRKLRLSTEDDKAWPIERWAALLQKVHARMPQAVIVLCGAPRESLLLSWIQAAVPLPAVAAAQLPLPRLLALCARAHSMISVDTGPAHAAAALSLPLVVMFGAHAQAEWLPRSPDGSAVVGVGGPPHSSRLDQISVETVFAAWCALPAREPTAQEPSGTSTDGGRSLTPKAASATAP